MDKLPPISRLFINAGVFLMVISTWNAMDWRSIAARGAVGMLLSLNIYDAVLDWAQRRGSR